LNVSQGSEEIERGADAAPRFFICSREASLANQRPFVRLEDF
jgi:hypothetical protein